MHRAADSPEVTVSGFVDQFLGRVSLGRFQVIPSRGFRRPTLQLLGQESSTSITRIRPKRESSWLPSGPRGCPPRTERMRPVSLTSTVEAVRPSPFCTPPPGRARACPTRQCSASRSGARRGPPPPARRAVRSEREGGETWQQVGPGVSGRQVLEESLAPVPAGWRSAGTMTISGPGTWGRHSSRGQSSGRRHPPGAAWTIGARDQRSGRRSKPLERATHGHAALGSYPAFPSARTSGQGSHG